MSRHSDEVRLHHMLDHAREAIALAQGLSRAELGHQRIACLALVRLLEVVGEAAARCSTEFQSRHPEITWPEIIGLRNRLIHGYDSVNLDMLWEIVSHDLPPLAKSLETIVERQSGKA